MLRLVPTEIALHKALGLEDRLSRRPDYIHNAELERGRFVGVIVPFVEFWISVVMLSVIFTLVFNHTWGQSSLAYMPLCTR